MNRLIKFLHDEKQNFKMVNQSEDGFDLIIISDKSIKDFMCTISDKDNMFHIIWQLKFKKDNYILYKNCTFSDIVDNYVDVKTTQKNSILGKRIKVKCSGVVYYTENESFVNKRVKFSKHTYKNANLLKRIIKIENINYSEH